jgi:phosphoribosylformylglycinamidine synthase
VRAGDEVIVDCPVEAITSGRRVVRPARRRSLAPPGACRSRPGTPRKDLLALCRSVQLGSREYLYRHYDSEVQGRTWLRPGEADAVVLRVRPDRPTGVAFAVGGNPRWCAADPELGARHAVAEAARNVACAGARPWALTDCLNFGDPEDPEVMGDLEATLAGLVAAAEALGGLAAAGSPLPFVSGNVSLYNHAGSSAIPPTPIVMAAGVAARVDALVPLSVSRPGDLLVLVGEPRDELTGSAWLRIVRGEPDGAPPSLSLEREALLQELAVIAAESGWVTAAHDVSEGGLAITLVEMLLAAPSESGLGLDIDATVLEAPAEEALFSERPGIVFALRPERASRLFQAARERSLLAWPLGQVVTGGDLRVVIGRDTASWTAGELRAARDEPLERLWNEELVP